MRTEDAGRDRVIGLRRCFAGCGHGWSVSLAAALLFTSGSVLAQEVPAPDLVERLRASLDDEGSLCIVISSDGGVKGRAERAEQRPRSANARSVNEGEAGDPVRVIASCGGQGFVLGMADDYRAVTHRRSGAVAVSMEYAGTRQVWLFSQAEDGSIQREDVTGELARGAGRGVMSGLDDVTVDLAGFQGRGVIALRPGGQADARAARAADIDLGTRLRGRGNAGEQTDELQSSVGAQ